MTLKISRHLAAKLGIKQPKRKPSSRDVAREFDTDGCVCMMLGSTAWLCLPMPPSVNDTWRTYRNVVTLSATGKAYRAAVAKVLRGIAPFAHGARLSVAITAHAPDARRRDIDNLAKVPLDALTKAGLWQDDAQIDRLAIERGEAQKPGRIVIQIVEIRNA